MREFIRGYDKSLTVLVISLVFAGTSTMCGEAYFDGSEAILHFMKILAIGIAFALYIVIGEKFKSGHEHLINESYLVMLFAVTYIYSKAAYFPGGHANISVSTYIIGLIVLLGLIVTESVVHIRRKE